MAYKLNKKKSQKMEVELDLRVDGLNVPVILTITRTGISVRQKGKSNKLSSSWGHILDNCRVPTNAPSKFLSNPKAYIYD